MADVEVYGAFIDHDEDAQHRPRIRGLTVRFKGTAERVITRDTALAWLAGGHSLVTHGGSAHHPVRGHAIERVEAGGEAWLRTDTHPEAGDHLEFPQGH